MSASALSAPSSSALSASLSGGIGIALIAKDIWEFRHGVLPIIANEMKSADTRDKVQNELAKVIGEQINEHTRDISGTAADRVTEIWREFRRAHAKVLELAEKDEAFPTFLDTVYAGQATAPRRGCGPRSSPAKASPR